MFKLNTASLLWKCMSVHGCRQVVSNQIPGTSVAVKNCAINNQNTASWSTLLTRDIFTVTEVSSAANDTSGKDSSLIDAAPKRTPNVFALFVKDSFKKMPSDLPFKERFQRAAQEWRSLSDDQKGEYKKKMTEVFVRYREDMASYLESLSPEQLAELKKLRKEKVKDKTRSRIKSKLRKLNYPKRPCSAYIFYVRDLMKKEYPDGIFPPIKSPEHIRLIGIWSQRWATINDEERKPYDDQAEADRKRYYEALEKWKQDLAKPENEENLLQLERMSRKIENANKSDEEVKKAQKKVAGKIIHDRLQKKAKKAAASKKTTTAKAKPTKTSKKSADGDADE